MAKIKKNQKKFVLALVFLPIFAIAASSYVVYRGVENYIKNSSYFKIRTLTTEGITDKRYCDVMKEAIIGENIFCIDTRRLSERIRKRFPTFYSVVVIRVLPSELSIIAGERVPVAVLRRGAYYLFDTEGVAVSSFAASESVDFPEISGLENKISTVKVGASYQSGVLKEALNLARVLRLQRFAIDASLPIGNKMKISRIDAADPSNLSFFLGDILEIKVGHQDFENKIGFVPAILKSLSDDIVNVKYIDLRPKEPAVSIKKEERKK